MKKNLFFAAFLCLLALSSTYAQTWHFGNNRGLQFNGTNPPTIVPGVINTGEGSAIATDKTGRTILATDGRTIYNWRNNNTIQVIQNTGLSGNASSTQSAIIVPCPTDCNTYFVFAVDAAENMLNGGLTYLILTRNPNTGEATITTATRRLFGTTLFAEKLTAMARPDGGFWVLAHNFDNPNNNDVGNRFFAIPITGCSPINESSVTTSDVGLNYQIYNVTLPSSIPQHHRWTGSQGQMKFSHDGRRVAVAARGIITMETYSTGPGFNRGNARTVQVLDFDIQTGSLSNPHTISFNPPTNTQASYPYGVEFSPDGSNLYISATNALYRCNVNGLMSSPTLVVAGIGTTPVILPMTRMNIPANQVENLGALQLAPNNLIYYPIRNQNVLGTITPATSALGTLGLGNNNTGIGLPTVIQNNFVSFPISPNFNVGICQIGGNTEISLTAANTNQTINHQWSISRAISCTGGVGDNNSATDLGIIGYGTTLTTTMSLTPGCYIIKHGVWGDCNNWQEQREMITVVAGVPVSSSGIASVNTSNGTITFTPNGAMPANYWLSSEVSLYQGTNQLGYQNNSFIGGTGVVAPAVSFPNIAVAGQTYRIEHIVTGIEIPSGVGCIRSTTTTSNLMHQGRYAAPTITTQTEEIETTSYDAFKNTLSKDLTALTLYPNPTTGLITVQGVEDVKTVSIFDIMGKQLLQTTTNGDTQLEIDLTQYPAGMYFLKTDNGQVQKIVKQ